MGKLPFTISKEVRQFLVNSSMAKLDCDRALHIGRSSINGEMVKESIHLSGYEKGTLPKDSFYRISGLLISISDNVIKKLAKKRIVLQRITLKKSGRVTTILTALGD